MSSERQLIDDLLDEVIIIILENTNPIFDKDGKPCFRWNPQTGYKALNELRARYKRTAR
mgnify:CR=1 FL=1